MKNLTYDDRKTIEKLLKKGLSIRGIGRCLDRGHATISDEIRKGKSSYQNNYDAELAQYRSLNRQKNKGNKKKVDRRPWLKKHIKDRLDEDWSPEQIAGVLRKKYNKTIISHETIYQYIYSESGRELKLWLKLRQNHTHKRKKRGVRKSRDKTKIPDRISIHKRPEIVNVKGRIGDLETDSVIFSNQKWILSVQVCRFSKKCAITKLKNKTAAETKYALIRAIEDEYGSHKVKTITFDNGTENVKHVDLKTTYNIETYFCDSYCSWQKGLVENTNKLIRQYLPRNINMSKITQDQIYEIQEKLNNRPRKILGYKTPNEVYANFT
jgi:IS30 family transposase